MSVGSGPDGGYLVPPEVETRDRPRGSRRSRRSAPSPRVRQVSAARLQEAVHRSPGSATGWVGETAARPETGVADAGRAAVPGDGALRHAGGDADAARRLRRSTSTSGSPRRWSTAFAEQEGTAFVTGDGVNKPKGFLGYTKVADACWSWGKIGYHRDRRRRRASPATNPSDMLIDLDLCAEGRLPRRTPRFVMNRKTQAAIRKFKDVDGNYLWQPAAQAGGTRDADGLPAWPRPRTCRTSPPTASRSPSATSAAAI